MFFLSIFSVFILGLVIGSFITSYTYRARMGKSVAQGRSYCPKCKKKIAWHDNIPLLSFLFLGGRCRKCKKKISLRYPIIEISTAFLFVFITFSSYYCTAGLNDSFLFSSTLCFWQYRIGAIVLPYFLFVAFSLISIFVTDFEDQTIPDTLVYLLLFFTFTILILAGPEDFFARVFAGFILSFSFLLLHLITSGRGMGLGDVKLVLFAGILFGWKLALIWVFLSFVIGAIFGVLLLLTGKTKFGRQIAFGPFLIVSFFLVFFAGDSILMLLFPYFI